jgi:Restriction endonuclease BglII
MRIAGIYSFNKGQKVVQKQYPELLAEVTASIEAIDASSCKTKESKEKTMPGAMLFSPVALNEAIKAQLYHRGWNSLRVKCNYPTQFYTQGYVPKNLRKGAFREMDFIKGKLGVEVQFGKYSFMVYNVAAKMTIFKNLGHIDTGIEVVPVKALAEDMSSGVSYFEQFVWDLEQRGVSNIDIPVLILGIDA